MSSLDRLPGSVALPSEAVQMIEAFASRALARGEDLLDSLSAAQVPVAAAEEAVERLAPGVSSQERWVEALEQERRRAVRLERAREATERALAGLSGRVALPGSTLGPSWQHDVDVLVASTDLPAAADALRAAGFLDVQPLLRRLRRTTPGVHRLGVVEGGEVLASVELCTGLHELGPPADAAVERATGEGGLPRLAAEDVVRRRCAKASAARRLPLRSALELLVLLESGVAFPREREVAVALRRCAALERELVGEGPLARAAGEGRPRLNSRWLRARAFRVRRTLARRVLPARFVVAFSGIDGAGKSTQAARLVEALSRLEVPAAAQWLRIGYGDSALLQSLARLGRRLLPSGSGEAMKARAAGAPPDAHATRRGPLGWLWALAVTVNFVWLARRSVRRTRGAVLAGDRALPDALVGLDEGYGGSLELRLQRWLLERLAPGADLTFYLRVPPSVALARKEDIFAARVLEEHARTYDRLVADRPDVSTLDAQRPVEELGREVLRAVCAAERRG